MRGSTERSHRFDGVFLCGFGHARRQGCASARAGEVIHTLCGWKKETTGAMLQVGKPMRVTGATQLATAVECNGLASGATPRGRVGVQPATTRGQRPGGDDRHGYSGGEDSGGCGIGEDTLDLNVKCGNPMNLMVGSRMQQACARSGGGSRQGGENPRRRNTRDDWHRRAEAHRSRCVGVDTESEVDGGVVFERTL